MNDIFSCIFLTASLFVFLGMEWSGLACLFALVGIVLLVFCTSGVAVDYACYFFFSILLSYIYSHSCSWRIL